MGDSEKSHVLTMSTINPRAVEMEYAVRGPIVTRSVELIKELDAGAHKPFLKVVRFYLHICNWFNEMLHHIVFTIEHVHVAMHGLFQSGVWTLSTGEGVGVKNH